MTKPLLAFLAAASMACTAAAQPFAFQRRTDSVAFTSAGRTVWQFHFGKQRPVPHFYPVCLLDGTLLTDLGPKDHPHHHSLWFAWNKLNGVDYWSEPDAGRTQVAECRVSTGKNSARFQMKLDYVPPAGDPVLTERRTIVVSAPDNQGRYFIDWRGEFVAGKEPVHMKGGTAGGGYAGLSVRIAQTTHEWRIIDSEGREDIAEGDFARNTHGKRAKWMDFSVTDKATGKQGGIAILEHPSSFRHPSQWHNLINPKTPFGYFSPATLWSEPYDLAAGKTLMVYYRIVVHPGRPGREAIEREWEKFSAQD